MGLRKRLFAVVASQLGHPRGVLGRGVARLLNRGNQGAVTAAVAASAAGPGEAVADVGFGGAVGLPLLLDRVGAQGQVYGIEISTSMLARAAKRFRRPVAAGTLRLLEGSLTGMPLPDQALDAAITTNTVYFVPELERAFAELARVLRPAGRLVVGIADPDAMAQMPVTEYGFRLRPVAEVVTALQGAGFTLAEQRTIDRAGLRFHLLVARR